MAISFREEKGLPLPALTTRRNGPAKAASSSGNTSILGRLRRKKVILIVLYSLCAMFIISKYQEQIFGQQIFLFSLSKDDGESHPLPSDAATPAAKAAVQGNILDIHVPNGAADLAKGVDPEHTPTDALKKLAASIGDGTNGQGPQPDTNKVQDDIPSQGDRILLLLSAVRNKMYSVPSEASRRAEELMPKTKAQFVEALKRVTGLPNSEQAQDASLFSQAHETWESTHRKQSPLTVFSKSYCPYSRRAKELLNKMGASYDLYEVDQREDGIALQEALREVSGHRTFPTIFVRDKLIGGSDDLVEMERLNVLHGMLEAAGVIFHPKQ